MQQVFWFAVLPFAGAIFGALATGWAQTWTSKRERRFRFAKDAIEHYQIVCNSIVPILVNDVTLFRNTMRNRVERYDGNPDHLPTIEPEIDVKFGELQSVLVNVRWIIIVYFPKCQEAFLSTFEANEGLGYDVRYYQTEPPSIVSLRGILKSIEALETKLTNLIRCLENTIRKNFASDLGQPKKRFAKLTDETSQDEPDERESAADTADGTDTGKRRRRGAFVASLSVMLFFWLLPAYLYYFSIARDVEPSLNDFTIYVMIYWAGSFGYALFTKLVERKPSSANHHIWRRILRAELGIVGCFGGAGSAIWLGIEMANNVGFTVALAGTMAFMGLSTFPLRGAIENIRRL